MDGLSLEDVYVITGALGITILDLISADAPRRPSPETSRPEPPAVTAWLHELEGRVTALEARLPAE